MNARERVNKGRTGTAQAPPVKPTEYETAMHGHHRQELQIWIMQRNLARVAQVACAIGSLIGLAYEGFPGFVLGVAGIWLFGMAAPPPSETLDHYTNRKGR